MPADSIAPHPTTPLASSPVGNTRTGLVRILILFTLSGAAGLIYELVWFQLLRLTIGGSAHSLGVLLACFMGGLCLGSLLYPRVAPLRWHPLRTYAVMEIGIAACGLAMPLLLSIVNDLYLSLATTPTAAMIWRSLVCIVVLMPPTVLMGATLPALARWIEADRHQSARIGRLYAANVVGAVMGVFLAALVLLPRLGMSRTNAVAVGLNIAAALLAMTIVGRYQPPLVVPALPLPQSRQRTLTCMAYALSGMAALSFEVVWSRLMGTLLGATVYGFALVLGVFLLGLAIGGAAGSAMIRRIPSPRVAFALLQLAVVAVTGLTPWLVPQAAGFRIIADMLSGDDPLTLTISNLIRTSVVVFPGALCWGMLFPVAVACLGGALADPARPIGRLYAWNTVGSVLGSLLTSFILIPQTGTSLGTAHLILLPLAAAIIILWPRNVPAWTALPLAIAAAAVVFATDAPRQLAEYCIAQTQLLREDATFLLLAALPAFLGFELFLVKRRPGRLIAGAAATGLIFAFTTRVPPRLYELGRELGRSAVVGVQQGEIVYFDEGTMEPVVVSRTPAGPLQVSINSIVCASTVPDAMEHLRLLGHIPALLSSDPRESLVIGLGAGVTAGCVAIHDRVERVQVVELEPKVQAAAALFAETNHHVMDNPKVDIRIDDGRHFIATTGRRFGVITSDPIEPFWAGSAALYTVEHYRRCRDRLVPGGVFCQWLGIFGLDPPAVRSLLAAFADAFPGGTIWATPSEMILVGSTDPMSFDIPALRERLAADPDVARSLSDVGIRSIEELLGRYVCHVEALEAFIAAAPPNRDRTLTIQYTGWQSFYQPGRHTETIRRTLAEHRHIDPRHFTLAPGEAERFFRRLDEEWQEFLDPSRWPGPPPDDPNTTTAPGESTWLDRQAAPHNSCHSAGAGAVARGVDRGIHDPTLCVSDPRTRPGRWLSPLRLPARERAGPGGLCP